MGIDIGSVVAWAHSNQLAVTLAASAIIGTMPATLPSIREFPQWTWTWVHDSLKTFMNFRKAATAGADPIVPMVPAPPPVAPVAPIVADVSKVQQLNG